jgi:hypothetical protein
MEALAEAISQSETFQAVADHFVFQSLTYLTHLDPNNLATRLLYRVTGEELSPSVDWLLHVLTTREAPASFVIPIWGLSVESAAKLGPEWQLVPFGAIPDSHPKLDLLEGAQGYGFLSRECASEFSYV